MAIELPELIQRVRVDVSDLARGERAVRASGRANDDAARSADRLAASEQDAAAAGEDLGQSHDRQARSSDRAAAAGRRLADTVHAVRDATDGNRAATERLGVSELRLQVAQKRAEVAQERLNRMRDQGKDGTLDYQRAELAVIDALRRVARVQDDAARAAARAAASNDSSRTSLVRFARDAEKAGNAGRFLSLGMSAIRIPALVTGLGLAASAVSSLGAGAVALAGQLGPAVEGVGTAAVAAAAQFGPLTGAIASLPASLLAIKGSTAVFKQLVDGPAKAAEAIRKYGEDSTQAKRALDALSPGARSFARELAGLAGRLETIRRAGQAAALPGLTRALDRSSALLPVVRAGFVGVARSLSQVAREGADAFTTPAFRRDLGLIAVRNATLVRTLGSAAVSLASALRGVVVAAGPMTQAFADAGRGLARTTDEFANSADGQRRLATFFNTTTRVAFSLGRALRDLAATALTVGRAVSRGIGTDMTGGLERGAARLREFVGRADVIRRIELFSQRTFRSLLQFGRTVRDVTIGIVNLGSIGARAIGIDFTGGLERAAARFREFTQSTRGQSRIATFFANARPVLIETGRLIRDVAKAFALLSGSSELAPVIAQIRTELLPAITDLVRSVGGRLGPTIVDLATAFIKFNEVMSFSPILLVAGAMARLVEGIADLAASSPALSTVIASLVALRIAATGLAVLGKFSGITGLVTTLATIGPAGTAGAKGLTGFIQGLRGVSTESGTALSAANRVGGAFKGLAGRMGGVSGATRVLVGGAALGGLGLIATGAAIGIGKLVSAHRDARVAVEELTNAILADSGALAENTRTAAANRLEKSGRLKDAQKLGLSLETLTSAYLGDAAAIAQVRAATDKYLGSLSTANASHNRYSGSLDENGRAARRLQNAVAAGNAATDEAVSKAQRITDAIGTQGSTADATAGSIGGLTTAYGAYIAGATTATNTTVATRRAFIRTAIEAGNTRKAAKRLADQLGLIPAVVRTDIVVDGVAEAIAGLASVREAATGIPATVTIGVLNKIQGSGGDLGKAVDENAGQRPVSIRQAERDAAQASQRALDKAARIAKENAADIGSTAGATAGEAAGKAFSNQFVKSAGGDLTRAGQRLVDNLVTSLTGSQDKIRQTSRNLRELVRGAFSGDTEDRLLALVARKNRRLLELARQRDAIAARIKTARDDIVQGAEQAGSGLRDAITNAGDVTGAETRAAVLDAQGNDTGRTTTNVLRLIGNLRAKVAATKQFTRDLRELKRRGVNADTLRQLVEAGPEEGAPAARALAAATDEQLREINSLQGQLTTGGQEAGKFATDTLRTLGLQSIAGLIAGLRDGEGEVEAQMRRIARIMRSSLRAELGIHSPSTKTAEDARFAVDGIVGYIMRDGLRRAREAGAALGDAIRPRTAATLDTGRRLADLVPATLAAGAAGTVPATAPATTTNTGDTIRNQFVIHHLEVVQHNPRPETGSEDAATALRKTAAVLSR